MLTRIRRYLSLVCFAVAVASFASSIWMISQYQSSRPNQSHPEIGRVYRQNEHGSYVYLTAEEATGLSLLWATFLLGILLGGVMVPKQDLSGFAPVSRQEYVGIWMAMICYLVLIIFAGPLIARFAVSHGIVLSW
jgi:hypothetical protein